MFPTSALYMPSIYRQSIDLPVTKGFRLYRRSNDLYASRNTYIIYIVHNIIVKIAQYLYLLVSASIGIEPSYYEVLMFNTLF